MSFVGFQGLGVVFSGMGCDKPETQEERSFFFERLNMRGFGLMRPASRWFLIPRAALVPCAPCGRGRSWRRTRGGHFSIRIHPTDGHLRSLTKPIHSKLYFPALARRPKARKPARCIRSTGKQPGSVPKFFSQVLGDVRHFGALF